MRTYLQPKHLKGLEFVMNDSRYSISRRNGAVRMRGGKQWSQHISLAEHVLYVVLHDFPWHRSLMMPQSDMQFGQRTLIHSAC